VARIRAANKCYYGLAKILGARSLFRELKKQLLYITLIHRQSCKERKHGHWENLCYWEEKFCGISSDQFGIVSMKKEEKCWARDFIPEHKYNRRNKGVKTI